MYPKAMAIITAMAKSFAAPERAYDSPTAQ